MLLQEKKFNIQREQLRLIDYLERLEGSSPRQPQKRLTGLTDAPEAGRQQPQPSQKSSLSQQCCSQVVHLHQPGNKGVDADKPRDLVCKIQNLYQRFNASTNPNLRNSAAQEAATSKRENLSVCGQQSRLVSSHKPGSKLKSRYLHEEGGGHSPTKIFHKSFIIEIKPSPPRVLAQQKNNLLTVSYDSPISRCNAAHNYSPEARSSKKPSNQLATLRP